MADLALKKNNLVFKTQAGLAFKILAPQTFIVMSNRVGQTVVGHVGETIIVNDVSEPTRQKIEGYLAWKWALVSQLPVGHPYKNKQPLV